MFRITVSSTCYYFDNREDLLERTLCNEFCSTFIIIMLSKMGKSATERYPDESLIAIGGQ